MLTALRRLLYLALIGGIAYTIWITVRRRCEVDATAAEWPPIPDPAPSPSPKPTPAAHVGYAGWAEPIDGTCPDGFDIKVNTRSGIFHVPGGRFYDRTVPDRCYATASDAEADGYRASKA